MRIHNIKKDKELTKFFVITWGISEQRNRQIYDGSFTNPHASIEDALAYQNLFVESQVTPIRKWEA